MRLNRAARCRGRADEVSRRAAGLTADVLILSTRPLDAQVQRAAGSRERREDQALFISHVTRELADKAPPDEHLSAAVARFGQSYDLFALAAKEGVFVPDPSSSSGPMQEYP